jgi:hypothetical protein
MVRRQLLHESDHGVFECHQRAMDQHDIGSKAALQETNLLTIAQREHDRF